MQPIAKRKQPMQILLIEDSLTFARVTVSGLRRSGIQHRLTWLTDGEQALDFLFRRKSFVRAPRPDVILLDLGLPKRDGRDVLFEIRQDDDLRGIPVVVLTASTDEADAMDCELLGVESLVVKPVDLDKFADIVRKLSHCWREDMLMPVFG